MRILFLTAVFGALTGAFAVLVAYQFNIGDPKDIGLIFALSSQVVWHSILTRKDRR